MGGYTPEGYEADAAALHLLNRWGVRYVIWHSDWAGKAGPANGPRTPLVRRFADGTSVYAVAPSHGLK